MNYMKNLNNISNLADQILSQPASYTKQVADKTQGLGSSIMPRKNPKRAEAPKDDLEGVMAMYLASIRKNKMTPEEAMSKEGFVRPKSRLEGLNPSEVGQRLMSDLINDFGFDKAHAAGIVGNLDYETGGFKFMQEIEPVVKGSRGGYGFAQWTGPRRVEFEDWAEAEGLSLASYGANYGNLSREMQEGPESGIVDKIKNTKSYEEAAKIFSSDFLRPGKPNLKSRIARAAAYYETYEEAE